MKTEETEERTKRWCQRLVAACRVSEVLRSPSPQLERLQTNEDTNLRYSLL